MLDSSSRRANRLYNPPRGRNIQHFILESSTVFIFIKTIVIFILTLNTLQTLKAQPLYRVSQATLVATSLTDSLTSQGLYERNPLLRSERGTYSIRKGLTFKLSLIGTSVAIGEARSSRRTRKYLTIYNFAASGLYLYCVSNNLKRR